jgi:hypothetical protein
MCPNSILRFITALTLLTLVPMCNAQAASPHLDRHASKIHKVLATCPPGSHLHLTLEDQTNDFGDLGTLSEASFELLNPKSSMPRVIRYDQVTRVDCEGRVATGPGIERNHHAVGFLLIVGVAVGVAVAILASSKN